MSQILYMTSILEFLYRFSQTEVGRKSKVLMTRSLPGGLGGRSPPMCRPPSTLVSGGGGGECSKKVSSNLLKVAEQVA